MSPFSSSHSLFLSPSLLLPFLISFLLPSLLHSLPSFADTLSLAKHTSPTFHPRFPMIYWRCFKVNKCFRNDRGVWLAGYFSLRIMPPSH